MDIDIFNSWADAGTVFAALVGGVMVFLYPYLQKIKKSKFLQGTSFDWSTHTQLHETLTELRVQTDCARTQIVQFHNGGEFFDGISMQKMSLTHESLANGCSSEMGVKKDVLLSLCMGQLKLLVDNNPTIHVVGMMEESWCKKFMQTNNVVAFSFLPLRKNKEIIGYLMCQWCSWTKADMIEDEQVHDFVEQARDVVEITLERQLKNRKV